MLDARERIDEAVAIAVFGFRWASYANESGVWHLLSPDELAKQKKRSSALPLAQRATVATTRPADCVWYHSHVVPTFSTDEGDALTVVDAMKRRGWRVEMANVDRGWTVAFIRKRPGFGWKGVKDRGRELPLAVCLAALKALTHRDPICKRGRK